MSKQFTSKVFTIVGIEAKNDLLNDATALR